VTENPPACWANLLDPRFDDDVQVANPNSSGTSCTMLATMVQLMVEDEAFAYLAQLHNNISQYTQSGSAPIRAAATGETAVGIVFMHDAVAQGRCPDLRCSEDEGPRRPHDAPRRITGTSAATRTASAAIAAGNAPSHGAFNST
jgi:ABC-type thiamine transport system substrate-binding protein